MNNSTFAAPEFFTAGGTLRYDAPSYVQRPADALLRQQVMDGKLCYVLTTRQMGKSSLMNRLAHDLQDEGVCTAIIDLTTIGTAEIETWYLSLLDDLQTQLDLETDVEAWWELQSSLSPVKRFTKFFKDVLLPEVEGEIAVFIDEIDSMLHFSFSDDFFAAIRAIYNQTLTTKDAGRLSFVLLGVATPNELIKDQRRTPFNIGERIDLEELDIISARQVFKNGLPQQNDTLVERIFYWTNGHPYLTQRIAHTMVRDAVMCEKDDDVDQLVARLFFEDRALVEESNLQFINGRILSSPQKNKLLQIYRRIYRSKKPVLHDEHSAAEAELKLYGLVKVDEHGHLVVRNRIYQTVFDTDWIEQNQERTKTPVIVMLFAVITLIALGFGFYFWQQAQRSNELLAQTYIANFTDAENPSLKMNNLAQLIALGDYDAEALQLFSSLSPAEQIALFSEVTEESQPQAEQVVKTVYMSLFAERLDEPVANTAVLEAMRDVLQTIERMEDPALLAEIESWINGRTSAFNQDYRAAQIEYSVALSLNDENPATRYERALVAIAMREWASAIEDLDFLAVFDEHWRERVANLLSTDSELVAFLRTDTQSPSNIIEMLPMATEVTPLAVEQTEVKPTATILVEITPTQSIAKLENMPIQATDTELRGRIVYTCFVDDVDQICVIDANGAGQKRITNQDTTSWVASFVPHADEVVYSGLRDGVFGLYQSSLSGGDEQLLTLPMKGDYAPIYSPDGEQIVFVRDEADDLNIWIMDKAGSNLQPLVQVDGELLSPVWSPDGQQVAYVQKLVSETEFGLWIVDVQSRQAEKIDLPVENIGSTIDWSSNGRLLAFYAGEPTAYDIYLLSVDEHTVYPVTNGGNNTGPAFSPDSNWIAFSSTRDGDNEIYITRIDGASLIKLTDNETTDWQARWERSDLSP